MQNINQPSDHCKQKFPARATLSQNSHLIENSILRPRGIAMDEKTLSRVGCFIQRLKKGVPASEDPFDDGYYDIEGAIKRREEEEPRLALEAINMARAKIGLEPLLTMDDNGEKVWLHGQKVSI